MDVGMMHENSINRLSVQTRVISPQHFFTKKGNLVSDPQWVLRLWRKHFSTSLQGDDDTNTEFRDIVPNPIDDDGVEIPLPSHKEVKVVVMRLTNNKAADPDGVPAELFNTRCNELVGLTKYG